MRGGDRLSGFEQTTRCGAGLKNRHHGTKDNIPEDEPQVRDWSGFEKGCQSRYRCIYSAFVNVYHCAQEHSQSVCVSFNVHDVCQYRWKSGDVPHRLERASSIFYLFTAVLDCHCWDNLLLVDEIVMMLW